MKRIFLLFLCAALLTGVAGCGDEPQTDPIGTPEESYAEQYVVDPVINRFILAFNKQERYVLAGMVQNADLSCTAYVDICQVTMVATQQGLHFSLTGGNTIEQQNRMLDIFYGLTCRLIRIIPRDSQRTCGEKPDFTFQTVLSTERAERDL